VVFAGTYVDAVDGKPPARIFVAVSHHVEAVDGTSTSRTYFLAPGCPSNICFCTRPLPSASWTCTYPYPYQPGNGFELLLESVVGNRPEQWLTGINLADASLFHLSVRHIVGQRLQCVSVGATTVSGPQTWCLTAGGVLGFYRAGPCPHNRRFMCNVVPETLRLAALSLNPSQAVFRVPVLCRPPKPAHPFAGDREC
jgi:hypothetical protein